MGHWSLALLIANITEQRDCSADPCRFNVLYSHRNTQLLPPQCCRLHPGAFLPSTMFGIPQQGCAAQHPQYLRAPLHNVHPLWSWGWVQTLWRESSPQPWEPEKEMCVNSKVFYYPVSSESTTTELLTYCNSRVISLLFLDDHLSAVS